MFFKQLDLGLVLGGALMCLLLIRLGLHFLVAHVPQSKGVSCFDRKKGRLRRGLPQPFSF
jgi:hypothetical protein